MKTDRVRGKQVQRMSGNPSVLAWVPSEIARQIDSAEFAVISDSVSSELEAEADALGVYLAAYCRERHASKERLQLCACLKIAEIDQVAARRLDRLQARLGLVLVAYARPLIQRV